jgi:hypothetical protein
MVHGTLTGPGCLVLVTSQRQLIEWDATHTISLARYQATGSVIRSSRRA